MPTFGSLFSGIGGIDLGLERAGWECRWQVEIDLFCRAVLAKHWPKVARYSDVRAFGRWPEDRVDLICGGFPCQPVSKAGARRGISDERWLWPEFARIVRLLRPRLVLVENVPGLASVNGGAAMGQVLGDLASSGYDTEWDCIPAAAIGAPHLRDRTFIVAYPNSGGHVHREPRIFAADRKIEALSLASASGSSESVSDSYGEGWADAQGSAGPEARRRAIISPDPAQRRSYEWLPEPDLDRVVDGIPGTVDRLRLLGNAVVPQVAEWIGHRLMDAYRADNAHSTQETE